MNINSETVCSCRPWVFFYLSHHSNTNFILPSNFKFTRNFFKNHHFEWVVIGLTHIYFFYILKFHNKVRMLAPKQSQHVSCFSHTRYVLYILKVHSTVSLSALFCMPQMSGKSVCKPRFMLFLYAISICYKIISCQAYFQLTEFYFLLSRLCTVCPWVNFKNYTTIPLGSE